MDVNLSIRPSTQDLWAEARAHLDQDLQANINFDQLGKIQIVSKVLRDTDEAQKQCAANAWRLRRKNGATVSVRDVLAKIAKWADRFKDIGDIAVQYDPTHAALPWAGVRFLLQIAVGDFQTYSFVLESIASLAELLCRHAYVEELLVRFSASQNAAAPPGSAQELRRSLVQLYVRVLTYLARARAYFRQSTAKRTIKSALLQPSDLEESFAAITAAQDDVDRCFHIASVQDELDRHQSLKDKFEELQAPLARWSDDLTKIADQLDRSKRIEILRWLSEEPYRKHHLLVKDGILEGTGQWLLSDRVYLQWKEDSASSVLWLHGIPGSGKSRLVSLVVEDALTAFQRHQGPPPAYFYCSRNPAEPKRSDPESILASIARQLSCLEPGAPLLQPTVAIYEACEEEAFAAESLRMQEIHTLIMQLSQNYPTITIILDALDECDPATRGSLVSVMESILQESPCLVKLFISSRDDQDIVYKFQWYPNLELSSDRNSDDIAKYVKSETDRLIDTGNMLRFSSKRQQLRQKIIEEVTSGAQGMFRWASLQLQTLCELKSDHAVLERLGRLPRTLEELYDEILQMIEHLKSPSDSSYAKYALSWLLCAQRRLSSSELLTAVSMAVSPCYEITKDQILDFCYNLVVFDKALDTFRFAHLSVREFLEGRADYTTNFSNAIAAETCLLAMLGSARDQQSSLILSELEYSVESRPTQLRAYSYAYWAPHCQAAATQREQGRLRKLLRAFLESELAPGSVFTVWQYYYLEIIDEPSWFSSELGLSSDMNKLRACRAPQAARAFVACVFDMHELIQDWSAVIAKQGLQNEDRETCQVVAAEAGSCQALQALLDIDDTMITEDVVKAAFRCQTGRKEVVALLRERRGDEVVITEDVVKATLNHERKRTTSAILEGKKNLNMHPEAALSKRWERTMSAILEAIKNLNMHLEAALSKRYHGRERTMSAILEVTKDLDMFIENLNTHSEAMLGKTYHGRERTMSTILEVTKIMSMHREAALSKRYHEKERTMSAILEVTKIMSMHREAALSKRYHEKERTMSAILEVTKDLDMLIEDFNMHSEAGPTQRSSNWNEAISLLLNEDGDEIVYTRGTVNDVISNTEG